MTKPGLPEYQLDAARMINREEAFNQITSVLPLPSYCGRNLDALHDALGEILVCKILIKNHKALGEDGSLGSFGRKLLKVFTDTALERDDAFTVILK